MSNCHERDHPTRPVFRWHGGKWLLAPWIISFFPAHRIYVEPFGGAASVLLRKPRAYAEVHNDLTPFARAEFELGWDATTDAIQDARRLIIRSFMGFGSNAHSDWGRGHKTTGFRANSSRSGTTPAHDWSSYPNALTAIVERFRGVAIDHGAAARWGRHPREQGLRHVPGAGARRRLRYEGARPTVVTAGGFAHPAGERAEVR